MPFRLFDAPLHEPSHFVGFAGNRIDRQAENRSEDALECALADRRVMVIQARAGRVYLKKNGSGFEAHFTLQEARRMSASLDEGVFLGTSQAGPVVIAPAGIEPDALPQTIKAIDYRSVYMQGLLAAEPLCELAQGASLLAWHANHLYCGRCGQRTQSRIGGYKRVCPSCAAEQFPRLDPVAIMLVVSDERCVLGRSPHFAPSMYSALAGFIEPGETIENAVRREVLEESGIRLGRVAYHASQPWPFPYSLMIGCYGEALNDNIVFDANELEDCRWFSRDDVIAIMAGEHRDGIVMPPGGAIAHHLIRHWAES